MSIFRIKARHHHMHHIRHQDYRNGKVGKDTVGFLDQGKKSRDNTDWKHGHHFPHQICSKDRHNKNKNTNDQSAHQMIIPVLLFFS